MLLLQAENLIIDITYRDYDSTGKVKNKVSFSEFVQLYINHRPAYGISMNELESAFNAVVEACDGYGTIDKDEFIDTICTKG